MQKRKKRDGHSSVFIAKLRKEIKHTQVVIYREFQKQQDGDAAPELLEIFATLDLQGLCQLLGTFMPIIKLT